MQLDHLAVEILKRVATEPGIPLKALCERIGLLPRNFYYRRTRIDDWLAAEGFSPLRCDAHYGVRLNEADVAKVVAKLSSLQTRHYKLRAEERHDNLLLHLACRIKPAFTQHLSELNSVSRNTTLDDLGIVKRHLQQQQLSLLVDKKQGYHIAGCDLALRLVVQHMLQRTLKYADHQAENRIMQTMFHYFQAVGLEANEVHRSIEQELSRVEKHIDCVFSDKDKRLLHYIIMFSILDTHKGHTPQFTPVQTRYLRTQADCQAAASLNAALSKRLTMQEVSGNTLFYSLLLSTSKKVTPHKVLVGEDVHLMASVKQLILQFQALSGTYLQDTEQLESCLFQHLGPAIQRCLFNMRSENVLREEIVQRYPLLFRFCRRIIVSIEQEYQIAFCDDELSYIVISFAAWMDRRPETAEQHILLVTEGGLSSTSILENQIRNLTILPVNIERISASQLLQQGVGQHIRLVVSTTALSCPIPPKVGFIQTQHMMSESEKQQLRLMLERNIDATEINALVESLVVCVGRQAPHLMASLHHEFRQIISQFIKKQNPTLLSSSQTDQRLCFVNFTSSQLPWPQLIRKAAQPLRERKIIDAQYVRNIVRQIEQQGITTYLTPDILLLHDVPPVGLTEGALSLLKLKYPLHFELPEMTITPKMIVILVPTASLTHIPLLEALNTLISDDPMLERLLSANSLLEVERCVHDSGIF